MKNKLQETLHNIDRAKGIIALFDESIEKNKVKKFCDNLLESLLKGAIHNFSLEDSISIRNHFFNSPENDIASFYMILAMFEKKLGVKEKYLQMLQRAHNIDPNHIEILRDMAFNEIEHQNFPNAINILKKVTTLAPKDWRAWNDAAHILKNAGNDKDALLCITEGSKVATDSHILYANKALLEFESHDYKKAEISIEKSLSINPNYPETLHTKAMLLGAIGKIDEAIELERKVLEIKPDYPQARLSLGLFLISIGEFEEGFMLYESRWAGSDKAQTNRLESLGRPMWSGRKVDPTSRIVITPEQGFGDMIQFSRFVPEFLDHFHKVDWVVVPEVYRLIHYNYDSENLRVLVDRSQLELNRIDYEIPFMSLMYALNLRIDTIEAKSGYLKVPNELNRFAQYFKNTNKLKVGIAWTGKATLSKQELRSVNPKLLDILDHEEIAFISLQRGAKDKPNLTHFNDTMIEECQDFMDTALLISNLDLVISVDTSIVHLAAALGKPTWLLNRVGSEWRWLIDKEDSIWYKNFTIFNQLELANWEPTLLEIKKRLHSDLN